MTRSGGAFSQPASRRHHGRSVSRSARPRHSSRSRLRSSKVRRSSSWLVLIPPNSNFKVDVAEQRPRTFVLASMIRSPHLQDEFRVGKDKVRAGYSKCSQRELLLIGTRGVIPAPAEGEHAETVLIALVGKHSGKPKCSPAPRSQCPVMDGLPGSFRAV